MAGMGKGGKREIGEISTIYIAKDCRLFVNAYIDLSLRVVYRLLSLRYELDRSFPLCYIQERTLEQIFPQIRVWKHILI